MGLVWPITRRVPPSQSVRLLALLALLFAASGAAHSAVNLVHRPYLQSLSENRVTIMWSTRENLAGTVQYSTDTSFALQSDASVHVYTPFVTNLPLTFYQYTADITGLAPGTTY